jgi:two-component system, NtrC family, response regulator AtoC
MPRLLIIDDEVNLARELSLFFRSRGYETDTAGTLAEGVRLFEEHRPSFVVSDVRLPDGTGLEALRRIRAMDPAAYVVMITAYQDMQTTIQAMRLGAFDYIHKPFNPEELDIVISKARENQRLHHAVSRLEAERGEPSAEHTLIGKSKAILEIYKTIGAVSVSNATVLVTGESGTGKELVARAIHHNASPKDPFISVNCSAIVETLLESELFGHEKGAFTGATVRKLGKFELAGKGTIFLDEVGDMAHALQTKLLRVLQGREFTRVGGWEALRTDARVIAATNQDLESLVPKGEFREDLYYRLKVIQIHIPPLFERREDIPLLVEHFLKKINREVHKEVFKVSDDVMSRLCGYSWRGNVRELENVLTRAVVLSKGEVLELPALEEPLGGTRPNGPGLRRLEEVEAEHIQHVLESMEWHQGKACQILGISRPTLRKKIRDYKLKETIHSRV